MRADGDLDFGRFIPACAGNSSSRWPSRCCSSVHPRVCGELPKAAQHFARRNRFIPACAGNSRSASNSDRGIHGSSPRVRGTPPVPFRQGRALRFIPACAGNSEAVGMPRSDGGGSSPRVRGTQQERERRNPFDRFIPACAGNSVAWTPGRSLAAVHPRVCGELPVPHAFPAVVAGSSPRVRGTRRHSPRAYPCMRFIPACAGNSSCRCAWRGG